MKKNTQKVIATWSGGKDSCFATFHAMQLGYEIAYLANTITKEYNRVGLHGTDAKLIQVQSELMGVPLLQKAVIGTHYEQEFTHLLKKKQKEVSGVVFGDIFLDECYNRNKKTCDLLGLECIEPLWEKTSLAILKEFISHGFETVLVSTQAKKLGKEWVGRTIDASFLSDIQKLKDIDPCGENGEYHTFVTNAPFFKKKIAITKSARTLRNGYWFLDIQKYKLLEKTI